MNTIPLLTTLCLMAAATVGAAPLKVFILAGQSNMQGHAKFSTFDYISKDPKTAELYKLMTDGKAEASSCDKVWISYLSEDLGQEPTLKEGKLGFGFGAGDDKIGPECTFSLAMEEALNEPILIIKTAWGGKNLHTQFRSPGAGEPGEYWTKMVNHVSKVLTEPGKVCPAYDPKEGYSIEGFVCFQGWNDMTDLNTYPKHAAKIISDEEQVALEGVSNFEFDYHGSAKVLGGIGVQFAEALIPLVKK